MKRIMITGRIRGVFAFPVLPDVKQDIAIFLTHDDGGWFGENSQMITKTPSRVVSQVMGAYTTAFGEKIGEQVRQWKPCHVA